jgi:hypothetical protein
MDLEKLIRLASDNMAEQSWAILATLRRPTLLYPPIAGVRMDVAALGPGDSLDRDSGRLNPKVILFFTINFLLGTLVNRLIPGRKEGPDLLPTFAVGFGLTLLSGAFLHWLCRLMHGRASLTETLSCYLQVASTMFLVSSFVALIWGAIIRVPQVSSFVELIWAAVTHTPKFITANLAGPRFLRDPISAYFIVDLVLQFIYLPIALTMIHGLRGRIAGFVFGVIGLCAVVGTGMSITLYFTSGLMYEMKP